MSKVYLSFLGLGSKKESGRFEYDPAVYELNGVKSNKTEFVQVAEMDILGAHNFDKLIIVVTQKSHNDHFEELKSQLSKAGAKNILHIIISEDMTPEGQWDWFERILGCIDPGDELTIDLTHGYRSVPIVLSTAINFLQKSRNIILNAVYYGAYEKVKDLGHAPIVDMKDFYVINEWSDAVSRLVEDADARKLAEVAERTTEFQVGELNDAEIIKSFEDLTNTVRNVDINNVAEKANTALRLIEEKKKNASVTGKILLKLVVDKFASITTDEPVSGKYDKDYFLLQLEIIKLLLEHKLFMQAYTVMREFIGSIGMIEVEKAKVSTSDGRKRRRRFAEVFVNMFQYPKNEWNFKKQAKKDKEKLMPYYEKLKNLGIEGILRNFTKDLADYRNGFDHAWTMKSQAPSDVDEVGKKIFGKLNEVVRLLEKNQILV